MFAVQGIYDEGTITINEPVPVVQKYDVVVTFLNPVETDRERKMAAYKRISGIMAGSTITLEEAREERLKRQ